MPRRRGKAQATLRLEEAILNVVEARWPITVRGVCYALFTQDLIRDMSTASTSRVSRVMTDMRETGSLDWTRVVDGSRLVTDPGTWSTPDELIERAAIGYRRDNWQDQPYAIEVWSEKSTIQGVLQPVLDEFGVAFRVMKGFGSYTAVRQAAEDSLALKPSQRGVALYTGDMDPSGWFMTSVDLPRRLERYGSAWQFERIAVREDDLDDLPHFDAKTKSGDVRYAWYVANSPADPSRCWELDAMSPIKLRERVREEIVARIDVDLWAQALRIEAQEKQSMRDLHASWKRALQR